MEILLKPVITEKMTDKGQTLDQYGFIVNKRANKLQIKEEVERMYGVTVEAVNTMIVPGKSRTRNTRSKMINGRTNAYKKAIITLEKGEKIDFYSNI